MRNFLQKQLDLLQESISKNSGKKDMSSKHLPQILEQYVGSSCEVRSVTNEKLLLGRVHKIQFEDTISIELRSRNKQNLFTLPYGIAVKLILKQDSSFFLLTGSVYISNDKFCVINNIDLQQNKEQRGFFRVRTRASGQLAPVTSAKEETAEEAPAAIANLLDISLSGLKFNSSIFLEENGNIEISELSLVSREPPFSFLCTIVARHDTEDGNNYIYRCTIDNLDSTSADRLCKAIFDLQREDLKKISNML